MVPSNFHRYRFASADNLPTLVFCAHKIFVTCKVVVKDNSVGRRRPMPSEVRVNDDSADDDADDDVYSLAFTILPFGFYRCVLQVRCSS